MNNETIAKRLLFDYVEINNIYRKKFRSFMISYSPNNNEFLLLRKKEVSHGCYVGHVGFEDCSKPVKIMWRLISYIIEINKIDWGIEGYGTQISNLLIQMYFENTHKIKDDGYSSGNMYSVAEKYYKQIKNLERWVKKL